jgi:hypothetical protein
VQSGLDGARAGDGRTSVNKEGFMSREIAGIAISMGIVLAASVGAARAQNSQAVAGIDAALRGAVERNNVPGVVALVTDRRRVLYQGAFGVADVSTGRVLRNASARPGRTARDLQTGSLLSSMRMKRP